jgi:MSHA pilin protein MshD
MCIGETGRHRLRAERGFSLLELIVFILLVSIAAVGVLAAVNMSTSSSADVMIRKQALAIAEAVLEEVQLMPFTYCDPDDTLAATALDTAGCTGGAGGVNDENFAPLGPEAGETRTDATTPYDNVSDYNAYSMTGITDITGAAITGLTAYTASVVVATQALDVISSNDSNLITVTVTGPPGSNTTVVLQGYRVRYAPNALP